MTQRPSERLSDAAIRRSVAVTLRDVVLPTLADAHARRAVIQLIALCSLPSSETATESQTGDDSALRVAIDSLRGNPHLAALDSAAAPRPTAAALLAAVVGDDGDAAEQVRWVLRPLLIGELDAALAEGAVLMEAFRGRLADA